MRRLLLLAAVVAALVAAPLAASAQATLSDTPVAIAWGGADTPTPQDITIPSGTTAVYMLWTSYNASTGQGLATATLEGVAYDDAIEVQGNATGDMAGTGVAVWYNPPTGAGQTLAISWNLVPTDGPTTIVAFVQGGDTTAWRDAFAIQETSSNPLTDTLITASGDFVLKLNGNWNALPGTSSGWTSAQTQGPVSQQYARLSTFSATGASTACDAEDESYALITCVAIPASGAPAPTREQEGFRWGVDDDTESAHTFEAAQDTSITIDDNQARLLRVLVDATGDPASTAYALRYQKNGSGGYVAVPVGAGTKPTPVIEAADATESGNNTATTSWAVSHPNASAGDFLTFCLSWDDSTDTTDVAEPAGPNGEVLSEVNATPAADSGTETRSKCWYTVATGTWTASTLTFTPSASEQWTGVAVRIPAGEFDASTPIGGSGVNNTAGGTDTDILNAALTAGGTDGSGKLVTWTSADADAQTVAAGWSQVANTDRGAVSGGFFARDTAVSDSESITAGTVATIASDSWSTVSFVVRAPTLNNEVYIAASANITAGGEATTARLTAPSGKTTSDFTTGRRWDDENGSDSIDIATDFYSELEWSVFIASSAANDDFFDFRVYADSNAVDTYTVTPRWTIPSAGGGSAVPKIMQQTAANNDEYGRVLVVSARW